MQLGQEKVTEVDIANDTLYHPKTSNISCPSSNSIIQLCIEAKKRVTEVESSNNSLHHPKIVTVNATLALLIGSEFATLWLRHLSRLSSNCCVTQML